MLFITSEVDQKSNQTVVVWWWWCGGGVVYLTDYRTTPGCSTLFNSGMWQYCNKTGYSFSKQEMKLFLRFQSSDQESFFTKQFLISLKLVLEKVEIMELCNKQDIKLSLTYQTLQQKYFLQISLQLISEVKNQV